VRLVALVLSAALLPLAAQGRSLLPWQAVPPLPWQPVLGPNSIATPPPPAGATTGDLEVQLFIDGTLRVVDARGGIRLLDGLPGRPLRAWRDGGTTLEGLGPWQFPSQTPLSHGLGALQWCALDFRPFLDGLLWILEDGEAFLTVVHPATGRIIYLPLPPGRDLSLRFLPDRLEVSAGRPEPGGASHWFLPWIALLPRLAALGPRPQASPRGTALVPFPHE
jgi:hypothetical protein